MPEHPNHLARPEVVAVIQSTARELVEWYSMNRVDMLTESEIDFEAEKKAARILEWVRFLRTAKEPVDA